MAENNIQKGATGQDDTIPATQPPAATAPAAQVDISKIEQIVSERASKSAEKIMRDMLEKQGFDSEAIAKMTADWKSKQVTPEQEIQRIIKERDDGFAERDAKIAAYEQAAVLRSHGVTDDEDIAVYGIRVNQQRKDGQTFEQAAKEYFTAHPRPTKVPATATFGGTGKTPLTPTELDGFKSEYEKARKAGNSVRMVEIRMQAKQKGFTLE